MKPSKGIAKNRRGVEGGAPHSVKMWGVFDNEDKRLLELWGNEEEYKTKGIIQVGRIDRPVTVSWEEKKRQS